VRALGKFSDAIPKRRDGSDIPILGDFLGNNAVKDALAQVKQLLAIVGGDLIPPPKFPIVEKPFTAIGLLLGKDIPLVTWELPEFKFYTPYYQTGFIPLGPYLIPYGIKGTVATEGRFGVGFDTRGFRQFAKSGDAGDIFNGFYINDNVVDGVDLPEFMIESNLLVAAGVISPPPNLAARYLGAEIVFDVGIGGTLQANGRFDLKDVDNDGKVHADEMADNIAQGFGCQFDVSGGIYGKLSAFAKIYARGLGIDVTIVDEEKIFADHKEDFATTCKSAEIEVIPDPVLPARLTNGQLMLLTSQEADRFVIEPVANTSRIKVTRTVSGVTISHEYDGVSSIYGDGKGGNDEIRMLDGVNVPAELRGGTGNDILQGGGGSDTLYGDLGQDTLIGAGGNDKIFGGLDDDILRGDDGDDTLDGEDGADEIHGGNNNDTIRGGLGNDRIWGNDGDDNIDAGASNDVVYGGNGNDRIIGGLGSDDIYGEAGADVLLAGENERGSSADTINLIVGGFDKDIIFGDLGADTIYGDNQNGTGNGDDLIQALDGNNVIYAGAGNDNVTAGGGNDKVWGGSGNDQLNVGSGNDEVYGEAGDDVLTLGAGNDKGFGDDGNDKLYGGIGSDDLYGGNGNDTIQAGEVFVPEASAGESGSRHVINAGSGNNLIFGDFGNDEVTSGDGADTIYTFGGNDIIRSGGGDDWIVAGTGSDFIVAGLGRDTVYGGVNTSGGGLAIDANVIYGDDEVDDSVLAGPAAGPQNADTIYGDIGNDRIYGNTGDDTIFALGGNNIIFAGWGSDTIFTGSGPAENGNASDTNSIEADPANSPTPPIGSQASAHGDRVYASRGNDSIWTGPGSDIVVSYDGNDSIFTGNENDTIDAGNGDNVVYSGAGNDIVITGSGNDLVQGEDGDDQISTGDGADVVYAGSGDDIVQLGIGDDFAVGGTGNDSIEGNAGRDVLWGGNAVISVTQFTRDIPAFFAFPTNFPGAIWTTADDPNATVGMVSIVPTLLLGRSVEGEIDDGNDKLLGGEDNDWIWGGGQSDEIDGGSGNDYLDGGSGDDSIRGGAGLDTMRGGSNNDMLRGDEGIDQLFGDDGIDRLYGDAGDINGVLLGQRLFGGDGIDYLYGFSYSTQMAAILLERTLRGDELHGGTGGDFIFGSIRSDILYGDDGNETLFADALAGPLYADWDFQSTVGGNDIVYGGNGDDQLYGGGGDDQLWGGFDSDWLEGQNGVDTLYGGSGIDKLILDTKSFYDPIPVGRFEVFDGHFKNEPLRAIPDDNATDILVINGTDANDTILVGQKTYSLGGSNPRNASRLVIRMTTTVALNTVETRVYSAEWRSFVSASDPNGLPLVEQFQIAGLAGNDTLRFIDSTMDFVGVNTTIGGVEPLDVSDLDSRSDDWVGVLDGGSGNDTLQGSGARDRIDGGRGSDTIYGMAGDDQLWGDGGPTQGNLSDYDRMFGGAGNDDMIGGQGLNDLFAWTRDPDVGRNFRTNPPDEPTLQFGIFVGGNGIHRDDNGDLDNDGALDEPGPRRLPYSLEDTGLNRVLGGPRADNLFGGTGLDFLYGNGAEAGKDQLFDRRGKLFESRDGGVAGDEWKDYAKNTDKVWYYGASNKDDNIAVDFVTEPGVLQGHHLITRLTNNNGNFTFDAQIQLDFGARNEQGNLIWNPNDSYFGTAIIGGTILPSSFVLSQPARFSLSLDGGAIRELSILAQSFLTTSQFLKAVNEAIQTAGLDGQLSARLSEGKLAIVRTDSPSANASILVASTNLLARERLGFSDGQLSTVGFVGSYGLSRLLPAEGDFQAIIIDALDGNDIINVGPTVTKSVWTDAGRGNDRVEYKSGRPILTDLTEEPRRNDTFPTAYDLDGPTPDGTSGIQQAWRSRRTILGLTLDNPSDVDWYKLSFNANTVPRAGDSLRITSLDASDGIKLSLYELPVNQTQPVLVSLSDSGRIDWGSLKLVANKPYWLKIESNANPTVYQLDVTTADWAEPNANPANAYDLSTGESQLQKYAAVMGLTLHDANDQDWFRFRIESSPANDSISLVKTVGGNLKLSIYKQNALGIDLLRSVDTSALATASLSLADLSQGEYFLAVSFNNSASSRFSDYELRPLFASSPSSIVLDTPLVSESGQFTPNNVSAPLNLASHQKVLRRDVLLGGDGNDILIGGSWEDWIIGGNGNDVLSGGSDRQSQDLLWGGDGDDIFQVLPDQLSLLKSQPRFVNLLEPATLVSTQSDRMDGGNGNDQVLYLGGDVDVAGRVVPDNVAITFNTTLHRYELTARVWDTANQAWISSGNSGLLRQDYAYFMPVAVEQFVLETRSGDDEIHADENYHIPDTASSGRLTWGITADMIRRGASLQLVMRGGAGSDRMFSGAGDDFLDGGAGDDVVLGGDGNDTIDGANGNDWLAGGSPKLVPDRYEFGSGASNDVIAGASFLTDEQSKLAFALTGDLIVQGLNLHQGDAADWYAIKTPTALFSYGVAKAANVLKSAIQLQVLDPSLSEKASLSLFPARLDASSGRVVPVEQFVGVPEYYLLGVINDPTNLEPNTSVAKAVGAYTLTFKKDIWAQTTDLAAGASVAQGGAEARITMADSADTASILPIGDIDGDGFVDFIGATQTSGSGTLAKVYFGKNLANVSTNQPAFSLMIPPTDQMKFLNGDFNGDSKQDIAIFVSGVGIGSTEPGIRILLGRERAQWTGTFDVINQADITINQPDGFGFEQVASAGDVNGDGSDDFLIGSPSRQAGILANAGAVGIYYGSSLWQRQNGTQLATYSFDDSLSGFVSVNSVTTGIADPANRVNWHQSEFEPPTAIQPTPGHTPGGTAVFNIGLNSTGQPAEVQSFDVGQRVVGSLTSPAINLAGYGNNNLKLSFSSLLNTENTDVATANYDKARVRIAKARSNDPNTPDFEGNYPQSATLAANAFNLLTSMTEFESQTRILADGRIDSFQQINLVLPRSEPTDFLYNYAGKLWLQFDFDSVDAVANDDFGWYIDDVKVSIGGQRVTQPSLVIPGTAANQGLGISVGSVGDRNLDGKGDFGIIANNAVYIINGSASLSATLPSLPTLTTTPSSLSGYRIVQTGNINGIGPADFLLTSPDKTYVITNVLTPTGNVPLGTNSTVINAGPLQSIGDVNGDLLADLGGVSLEQTASVSGASFYHAVANVYLDPLKGPLPSLTIETGFPFYSTSSSQVPSNFFASLGDLNGDQRSELAIADTLTGRSLHVIAGRLRSPNTAASTTANSAIPFSYTFATPLITVASNDLLGIKLNDPTSSPHSLFNVPAIEGTATNQALSDLRAIGDFNGDGIEDFLVPGANRSYLLFGPLDSKRNETIEDRADVTIASSLPSRVSANAGDLLRVPTVSGSPIVLNRDGLSDVVFLQESGASLVVRVLNGDRNPNRLLDLSTATGFTIASNPFAPGTASASLVDRDGDGRWDLVLAGRDKISLQPRLQSYRLDRINDVWTPQLLQDQNYQGLELVANGGAELGTTAGWRVRSSFTVESGTAQSGSNYFRATSGIMEQDVSVEQYARDIDTGSQTFNLSGFIRKLGGGVGRIDLQFLSVTGAVLSQVQGNSVQSQAWSPISTTLTAPSNTRTIRIILRCVNLPLSPGVTHFDSISLRPVSNPVPLVAHFQDTDGDQLSVVPVGDLDGDGRQDVLVSNPFETPNSGIYVSLGGYDVPLSNPVIASGGKVDVTRVAGTRVTPMGDLNKDGYADFAIVNARRDSLIANRQYYAVEDQVMVFASQHQAAATQLLPLRTINRGNASTGTSVTLKPGSGDFNGDGKADLVILETVRLGSGTPLSGKAYLFWDINASSWASTLQLTDANVVINSDSILGILDNITPSPNLDLNNDSVSDLVLVSTTADATIGSTSIDVGRIFTVFGQKKQFVIPSDNIDSFANRSYSGSGDVLVADNKGQKYSFNRTLEADQWFEFKMLGDGLPGNSLTVSPEPADQISIAPHLIGSPNTYFPQNAPNIIEFELSQLLPYMDNPSGQFSSTQLNLAYTSNVDIQLDNLDLSERAVVNAIGPEVLYFVANNRLAYTDGTLGHVAYVGSFGSFVVNPTSLKSDGSQLVYKTSYQDGPDTLWLLNSPTSQPIYLYTTVFEAGSYDKIATTQFYYGRLVSTTQNGRFLQFDPTSGWPSDILQSSSLSQVSSFAFVGTDLFFSAWNSTTATRELWKMNLTSPIATPELNFIATVDATELTASALDGGTLFFKQGTELWRSNGTTANTTMVQAIGNNLNSLIDVEGRLYFVQGNELWTSDGTDAGTISISQDSDSHPISAVSSLTSINGKLYFSATRNFFSHNPYVATHDNSGVIVTRLYDVAETNSTTPPVTSFTSVGPLVYFAATSSSSGRELYATDGSTFGTYLVKDHANGFESSNPQNFSALNGQLTFGIDSGVGPGQQLSMSDGSQDGTGPKLGAEFTISLLKGKGDTTVTDSDASQASVFDFPVTLMASNYLTSFDDITLNGQLGPAIVDALEKGFNRLTMRLSPVTSFLFPLANVRPILQDSIYGQTTLSMNPVARGVLVDVFDSHGTLLAENASVVDFRNMDAGRYYVHAKNITNTLQEATFTFLPPIEGQTRLLYQPRDQDTIRGGDGNDTLIGNNGQDRMLGQLGNDVFVGDNSEVRDPSATEPRILPLAAESISNKNETELDPIISIPDASLRESVAKALNIPVTQAADAAVRIIPARPIRGSDMATLTFLDLRGSSVASLEGLQYATNLRHLNLSYVSSLAGSNGLAVITPRESMLFRDGPIQVGTKNLESLALNAVDIGSLSPLQSMRSLRAIAMDDSIASSYISLAELKELRYLSADKAGLPSLEPIAGLTKLRVLSVNDNSINSVREVSELRNLQHLYLANNSIYSVQPLTNVSLIDNGDTGSGFNQSIGSVGDKNTNAFAGDYRVMPAFNGTSSYTWNFSDVPKGLYDVQVTWPEHDSRSHQAIYTTNQLTPSIAGTPSSIFASPPIPNQPTFGPSKSVAINTDALTVVGDDGSNATFFGTAFTFSVKTIDQIGELASIVVHGNLTIGPDQIVITGSRPLSIVVENDIYIADSATIDASAVGTISGPGGGSPGTNVGTGGTGGTGGLGGTPGGNGGTDASMGFGLRGEAGRGGLLGGNGGSVIAAGIGVGFNNLVVNAHNAMGGSGGLSAYPGYPRSVGGKPGVAGEPGQFGSNGDDALAPMLVGQLGGSGTLGASINPLDFRYFSGGSAGGAGAGGGAGSSGSGGASGQGGGKGGVGSTLADLGGDGGRGGVGGAGGTAGNGGTGGRGGAGGGAFEIAAAGRVYLGSNTKLRAQGGDGQTGQSGLPGNAGANGLPGETPGAPTGNGMIGGNGGNGGRGSDGTLGGAGGVGGGGSGGSVRLNGSVVNAEASAMIDVKGGNTANLDGSILGNAGVFQFSSNTTAPFAGSSNGGVTSSFGLDTSRANEFASTSGQFTPNIPGLVDGAEVFGLAQSNVSQVLKAAAVAEAAKLGAKLAVWRFDQGFYDLNYDFQGYDIIAVMNVSGETIAEPKFGLVISRGVNNVDNTGLIDLKMDGYTRTSAATLQSVQGGLMPGQIWVTAVPRIGVTDIGFNVAGSIAGQVFSATNVNLLDGNSSTGRWVLSNALGSVDQALSPTGVSFGGKTWQTLRSGVPLDIGFLSVVLAQSADGNVAADAVRLIRVDSNAQPYAVLPNLQSLAIEGNPLDDINQDFFIGYAYESLNPAFVPNFTFTYNPSTPVFVPVRPVSVAPAEPAYVQLFAEDPDRPSTLTLSVQGTSGIIGFNSADRNSVYNLPYLDNTTGIAFGPDGSMFVAQGTVIVRYREPSSASGTYDFIQPISTSGSIDALAMGPDGNLYAATNENRILRYDISGQPLPTAGNAGAIFTSFIGGPRSLAFGPNGNLFVSTMAGVFEIRSTNGTIVGTITATPAITGDIVFGPNGHLYGVSLANTVEPAVLRYEKQSNGTYTGFVVDVFPATDMPQSIAFAPNGRLYVQVNSTVIENRQVLAYESAYGLLVDRILTPNIVTRSYMAFSRSATFYAESVWPIVSTPVIGNWLTIQSSTTGSHRVVVTATDLGVNQKSKKSFTREFDFNVGRAGLYGTIYHDANFNGTRGLDENGSEGIIVYIDANLNNAIDSDEPTTTSDANGNYRFNNLPLVAGTRTVRQAILPGGPWIASQIPIAVAANATRTIGVDFGNVRIVDVGVDRSTNEGSSIEFTGQIIDPNGPAAGTNLTYIWEVRRNGQLVTSSNSAAIAGGATVNFSFTPPDNGVYVV